MSLLNIPLADITADTIKTLLESDPGTNKESLTLDFKAETQVGDEKSKQQILKWVASYANTAGGDLLIGVKQNGTNYSIVGLDTSIDTDKLQLQVSDVIRLNFEPRLSRPVEFRELEVDGARVLIVRTHQSFNKPHGIKVGESYKFYVRLPNGQSVPMDIQQVRSAFVGSETLIQQVKAFKADRIGSLLAGIVPFILPPEGKMVIHMMPVEAFSQNLYIDPQRVSPRGESIFTSLLAPLRASGWDWRYNFDGFAAHDTRRTEGVEMTNSYTQLFRNGALEFVCLSGRNQHIPSLTYEELIGKAVNKSLEIYRHLDIGPPYFASITFVGVKGYSFGVGTDIEIFQEPSPLDRDVINLPDIRIDTHEIDVLGILRPAFDTFWQCFGYECSYNYDKDGKWYKRASY